ncbi:MAG: DnaJ domain-containing protein [Ktedonobacterales bacterium]|nr:DnaJ domain-containing protein [Ktedonobacterales bacterium]
MAETQLSFFDADAAREHERKQKDIELNAFILKVLGPKGAKRWHEKNATLQAKLDEIRIKPLRPDLQAAVDRTRAKVLAATKPLTNEFAQLGIAQGATKREIKNAYRRQARKLHPDAGGDDAAFKRLHEAYRRALASVRE